MKILSAALAFALSIPTSTACGPAAQTTTRATSSNGAGCSNDAICAPGVCFEAVAESECPSSKYLGVDYLFKVHHGCTPHVKMGELCEADGECGTSNRRDNCPLLMFHSIPISLDVYKRVECCDATTSTTPTTMTSATTTTKTTTTAATIPATTTTTTTTTTSATTATTATTTTYDDHRRYLAADHESAKRYIIGMSDEKMIDDMMSNHPVPIDYSGTFQDKENILSEEQCNLLVDYLDADSTPSADDQSDAFQVHDRTLSAQELANIVGKEKVEELLQFFYKSVGEDYNAIVRKIWLRRVDNDGSVGNYVDLHTDHNHAQYKQSTMIVALNSEDDIEGGELFYLNQDGTVNAHRAQGKAYAHKYDVYHGVAPHKGSRVSLLIHLDHEALPEIEDLIKGTDLFVSSKKH